VIPSSKVLWGEGLFLRPQHFQQQDAYHEWRLADAVRTLHPYAWGVRACRIDADALQAGVLRFDALQLVFADGESYSAPAEDELPEPVNLAALPSADTETTFHAAIAVLRTGGRNASAGAGAGAADEALRYSRREQAAADMYTDACEADIVVLKRSVCMLAAHEPRGRWLTVPVCRLRRLSCGGFEQDPAFIPPAVSLQAAPALLALVRRLVDILQAKVHALYGLHREPARHVIEFRSGDSASFWLLHTSSAACAALTHYLQQPALHPERLFERLLELAGALMTYSKTRTLADLPPYRHDAAGDSFGALEAIIRELLETVISTRCFAIALSEEKPSFHRARLASERIGPQTRFFLAVSAAMPSHALAEAVPTRFKVGAPDDVDKFVLSALPGVPLVHAQQVPAAVPVRPGCQYFAIEPGGPLYERMRKSATVTVYAPAGFPDLQLELVAVNP
jgi:type VI secretion system protein ImpJ